jgi:hypothetical protein
LNEKTRCTDKLAKRREKEKSLFIISPVYFDYIDCSLSLSFDLRIEEKDSINLRNRFISTYHINVLLCHMHIIQQQSVMMVNVNFLFSVSQKIKDNWFVLKYRYDACQWRLSILLKKTINTLSWKDRPSVIEIEIMTLLSVFLFSMMNNEL